MQNDLTKKILQLLHLKDNNFGGSTAADDWLPTKENGYLTSINPATGDAIANVYRNHLQDYEAIIEKAKRAQLHCRTIPAPKRGEIVRKIGDALRLHKAALGTLVTLESGKSLQEGLGEVQEMIDMADFAVGQSRMLYGKTMPSERFEHRLYEQWQPLGVVGIISAFNFPVAVWAWNAFLAIICGNTVIWKPSPKTPLTALAVQHICNQVMAEEKLNALFSILTTDDVTIVEHMANDPRINLLSFTGSSTVGRDLSVLVAKRHGKCLLELSGNNAVIVDETATLDLALPAILFGAIGTAGQRCTSIRRLIIQNKIYDAFIAKLITAYQQIKMGNPLDPHHLLGPVIDEAAQQHYLQAIKAAKQQGGTLLYGGHTLPGPGFYVEPTLIAIDNHAAIVQQETFAPILYVMRYEHFEDAIAMQNNSHFGLSSALFSESSRHVEAFLSYRGSDCGIACINQSTSGAEIGGAFGGEKATGGGREAGSDAWQAYMRRQTVSINWSGKTLLAQGIAFKGE